MNFINPKTDFAFKKIFGSEQSQDILISFLNALLYNGDRSIKYLEILNPYLAPRIRGIKDTYLDVKATLDNDTTVIIEMQVLNVESFEKRILYNAAKAYSIQLDAGEDYLLLNPVIALTITDFEMFPNLDKIISRFILKERDFLIDYPSYDIELVFAELPKFKKELNQLETVADKWLYFLKRARSLQEIPESMGSVPEIQKAFEIADRSNLNRQELEDLEHREIYIHDQRNAIKKALNQGIQQGIQQGREQGREQGLQQGLQQGKTEAKIEIVKQMLDRFDDSTISQITELSLEEIQSLRRENQA